MVAVPSLRESRLRASAASAAAASTTRPMRHRQTLWSNPLLHPLLVWRVRPQRRRRGTVAMRTISPHRARRSLRRRSPHRGMRMRPPFRLAVAAAVAAAATTLHRPLRQRRHFRRTHCSPRSRRSSSRRRLPCRSCRSGSTSAAASCWPIRMARSSHLLLRALAGVIVSTRRRLAAAVLAPTRIPIQAPALRAIRITAAAAGRRRVPPLHCWRPPRRLRLRWSPRHRCRRSACVRRRRRRRRWQSPKRSWRSSSRRRRRIDTRACESAEREKDGWHAAGH
jgi:hypothetical protein